MKSFWRFSSGQKPQLIRANPLSPEPILMQADHWVPLTPPVGATFEDRLFESPTPGLKAAVDGIVNYAAAGGHVGILLAPLGPEPKLFDLIATEMMARGIDYAKSSNGFDIEVGAGGSVTFHMYCLEPTELSPLHRKWATDAKDLTTYLAEYADTGTTVQSWLERVASTVPIDLCLRQEETTQ